LKTDEFARVFPVMSLLTLIMIDVSLTNYSILLVVLCQNQKSMLTLNNHLICPIFDVDINLKFTWNGIILDSWQTKI